jgi:hypothetical protein
MMLQHGKDRQMVKTISESSIGTEDCARVENSSGGLPQTEAAIEKAVRDEYLIHGLPEGIFPCAPSVGPWRMLFVARLVQRLWFAKPPPEWIVKPSAAWNDSAARTLTAQRRVHA